MQVIDLGKLRFQMRGEWKSAEEYGVNDVVTYGGIVCVYTYPLKKAGRVPTDVTYWTVMLHGTKHAGDYSLEASYRIGESVTYGGSLVRALQDIAPGQSPEANPAAWSVMHQFAAPAGAYQPGKLYRPGVIVAHGASTFIATESFLAADFDSELASGKWASFVHGLRYRGIYQPGANYCAGDLTTNGLHLSLAKRSISNAPPNFTPGDWQIVARGSDELPAQMNQAGKALVTDGTSTSWQFPNLARGPMLEQLHAIQLSM